MRPAWTRRRQVLRHRNDDRDLAVGFGREDDDAAAETIAQRVGQPAKRRLLEAVGPLRGDLDAGDDERRRRLLPAVRRPRAPASSSAARPRAPAAWRRPAAAAPISTRCGGVVLSALEQPRATRAVPVSARPRRQPGERLDAAHAGGDAASSTMMNGPMSPVARTCVPPHSSMLKPGIDTTRTRSPYFSPNSAIAPAAIASSVERTSVCTGVLRTTCSLTMRFDRDRSARASSRQKCTKSNRRRSGATSEPACLTCAAEDLPQRRVQQVRGRVIAPRRVAHRVGDLRRDDLSRAGAAPCSTRTWWRRGRPPGCRSIRSTRASASAPTSRPLSETWPPASR